MIGQLATEFHYCAPFVGHCSLPRRIWGLGGVRIQGHGLHSRRPVIERTSVPLPYVMCSMLLGGFVLYVSSQFDSGDEITGISERVDGRRSITARSAQGV